MLKVGMQKSEIDQELAGKGDFVQIAQLTEFLKEEMTLEMKKFVTLKLASLYEKTKMFSEAARFYDNASMISIAFSEKMKYLVKEAELFIKSGQFGRADEAMKKAMSQGNSVESNEIYITIKHFYKSRAEDFEREGKKGSALRIYEKLWEMKLSEIEKKEIRERLLNLYEKLGRRKEYIELEKGLV